MKALLMSSLFLFTGHAFAQDFLNKIKDQVKDIKVEDVKKKGCPMVNGKEDCNAEDLKNKAVELKKKLGK